MFSGIHDSLLNLMAEALGHLFKIKAEAFDPITTILNLIYESELFRRTYPDIKPFYNNLQEIVRVRLLDYFVQVSYVTLHN